LQEIRALDVLVRPSVNPALSNYCTKLTDITDEQIRTEGIELHETLHKFVDFVGDKNIFSYGDDILVILESLGLNNIVFDARTLQSHHSIVINEYNHTDSCLESNAIEVILYGSKHKATPEGISEGVHVEIYLNGDCVQLSHYNLKSWFHANAPETQGKPSGGIAKILSDNELKGKIHNPLFDVRSIHMGLRELVSSRHIENPLR
jgi:hypothetical protein